MESELTKNEADQERINITKELWGENTVVSTLPDDDAKNVAEKPPENKEDDQPDPWAGVNPALRKEFEDLKASAGSALNYETRVKQLEKRVGSLTNELSEAKKAAAEVEKEKENAPTKDEIEAAAKSREKWEDLRDEFPEWAEAIDERLAAETARSEKAMTTIKELKDEIEVLKNSSGQSGNGDEKLNLLKEELRIEMRHPDWKEKVFADVENRVYTDDFKNWFNSQSAEVQAKANSTRSADAIYILDEYKKSKNGDGKKTAAQIELERKHRLENSQLPSGHKRTPSKTEDDMTDEEVRKKYASEIWSEQ